QALANRNQVKPLIPPERPILKIEFCNYGQAEWAHLIPGTEIVEGTTIVQFQAKDMIEAYRAMIAMTELALHTAFSCWGVHGMRDVQQRIEALCDAAGGSWGIMLMDLDNGSSWGMNET